MATASLFNRRPLESDLEQGELDMMLPAVKEAQTVDLDEPNRRISAPDGTVEYTGDDEEGDIMVTFGPDQPTRAPSKDSLEHDANLANFLSDTDNNRFADELIEMWDADEESNAPWRDKLAKGLEVVGFVYTKGDDLPFTEASDVTHPMIAEAIVQFNARAGAELMPPDGPCKGKIIGEQTQENRAQSTRLEKHMNYQMTEEDEGYYEEIDSLFFYAPFAGEGYTKTYFDDLHQITTTRFVKAENVVMPYSARGLTNSPRYTITDKMDRNTINKHMASGLYRQISLIDPGDENTIQNEIQELYDEVDGRAMVMHRDDPRHDIGEMNIETIVPGFEDTGLDGKSTGLTLPYLITIDKTNRTILSIYRNWNRNDKLRRRQHNLVQYKYLPGLGARGMGLLHIIGGIAEACTGSMRAVLDSAAFATLQGGFKSKDCNVPAGELTLMPGVWHDIDLSAEELSKAFYTPPFKEPSVALFNMYKEMVAEGRRFAGTTENVVGDAHNTGPVGTTVALIEQGTKVMSGIHKRMHRALRREFRIRARINAEMLPPDQKIFYDSSDQDSFITIHDYMNRAVNVVPVSDPNIVSATQRIAQTQGILSLSEQAPQLYKLHHVHGAMLAAMQVDDVDYFLRDPDKKYRFDAVSEGARLMAGLPIWAYQGQDHESHLAIHMVQLEYFKTLPEEQAQPLIMKMMEHLAKTEAYRLYDHVQKTMGSQLPPLDLYDEDPQNEMPPQVEAMVSMQAARFTQQLMQELNANKPPAPEDAKTQADIARKDAAFKQDQEQKQQAFQAEEARKQQAFDADQAREKSDTDPNSAQENIMRAVSTVSQRVTSLANTVITLAQAVQGIVPTPSNPSKGEPPNAELPPT